MQGVLLIDKPEAITSFGAVAQVKKLCGTKRVGHTGTLDPMATGLLPMLVDRATVLSDYLLHADKEYIAAIRLGLITDTLDRTGTVLQQRKVSVSRAEIVAALQQFEGEIEQTPPMYSAIKKDGVRLYELARKGLAVDRTPRRVTIKEMELLDSTEDSFTVRVLCSKGTYIRSLAADLGEVLSTGAALTALRRTKTAGFSLADCHPLAGLTPDNVAGCLLPAEAAVLGYPAVLVSRKQAVRFCNGGALAVERLPGLPALQDGMLLRVKYDEHFLGMGAVDMQTQSVVCKCLLYLAEDAAQL